MSTRVTRKKKAISETTHSSKKKSRKPEMDQETDEILELNETVSDKCVPAQIYMLNPDTAFLYIINMFTRSEIRSHLDLFMDEISKNKQVIEWNDMQPFNYDYLQIIDEQDLDELTKISCLDRNTKKFSSFQDTYALFPASSLLLFNGIRKDHTDKDLIRCLHIPSSINPTPSQISNGFKRINDFQQIQYLSTMEQYSSFLKDRSDWIKVTNATISKSNEMFQYASKIQHQLKELEIQEQAKSSVDDDEYKRNLKLSEELKKAISFMVKQLTRSNTVSSKFKSIISSIIEGKEINFEKLDPKDVIALTVKTTIVRKTIVNGKWTFVLNDLT